MTLNCFSYTHIIVKILKKGILKISNRKKREVSAVSIQWLCLFFIIIKPFFREKEL